MGGSLPNPPWFHQGYFNLLLRARFQTQTTEGSLGRSLYSFTRSTALRCAPPASHTPLWGSWNSWICVYTVNAFNGNKHVFGHHWKHALNWQRTIGWGQINLYFLVRIPENQNPIKLLHTFFLFFSSQNSDYYIKGVFCFVSWSIRRSVLIVDPFKRSREAQFCHWYCNPGLP